MIDLKTAPLLTLRLDVAFDKTVNVGPMPQGRRAIAPILGGTFSGDRLNGVVLPGGADWVINRPDGVMLIDVRIALQTDDKAIIYLTYQGRLKATAEALTRFRSGQLMADADYSLLTVPRFETGAAGYAWLNDVIAVGVGRQTAQGPIYQLHEIL
jgi:hypothetical protein